MPYRGIRSGDPLTLHGFVRRHATRIVDARVLAGDHLQGPVPGALAGALVLLGLLMFKKPDLLLRPVGK